jgi:hypothetical protein
LTEDISSVIKSLQTNFPGWDSPVGIEFIGGTTGKSGEQEFKMNRKEKIINKLLIISTYKN